MHNLYSCLKVGFNINVKVPLYTASTATSTA